MSINLHYADDIGFDDLLSRLIAVYGDPTSRRSGTPRKVAIWSDRMMTIALLNSGSGMMISIASRRRHR